MFAITGITGQVGGHVARALLAAGQAVRAVVRDEAKGRTWAALGCDVAVAEMSDAAALRAAFTGVQGVFVLLPPHFDPSPDFGESRREIAALHAALGEARPAKVVCLSTTGAQATQANLLNQLGLLEASLRRLPMPVAFLRAAWFIENSAWDIAPARNTGLMPSYLQPTDRRIPMVATEDVGRTAAALLQEDWQGQRIVELEGPTRVSPDDIAASLSRLLGRDVRAQPVPRAHWEDLFSAQGMNNPTPRAQMLEGFNAGWLAFEGGACESRRGAVALDTVLRALVKRSSEA